MPDRLSAPPALRNRELIARVLEEELPQSGNVLEVASGTGEHVLLFAERFPGLIWQPSDPDPQALASIEAWRAEAGLGNIRPPLAIDASAADWPAGPVDAMVCINMVHISPVAATGGLMAAAGRLLGEGGPLILYGPYLEDGIETVQSNLDFDASLRRRNPQWGLRDTAWMDDVAGRNGLARARRVEMPANNIVLVYRKA